MDGVDDFLKKVDAVNEAVQGLNAGGNDAVERADELLRQLEQREADHKVTSDRMLINQQRATATVESADPQSAFMAEIERDSKERTLRRQKNEKEAAVFKETGNELFKNNKYTEALEAYTTALRLWPSHLPLYTNRSLTYIKLGRYADALKDADWALRLHDKHPKALLRRGLALQGLERFDEAVVSLTAAHLASQGAARVSVAEHLQRANEQKLEFERLKQAALTSAQLLKEDNISQTTGNSNTTYLSEFLQLTVTWVESCQKEQESVTAHDFPADHDAIKPSADAALPTEIRKQLCALTKKLEHVKEQKEQSQLAADLFVHHRGLPTLEETALSAARGGVEGVLKDAAGLAHALVRASVTRDHSTRFSARPEWINMLVAFLSSELEETQILGLDALAEDLESCPSMAKVRFATSMCIFVCLPLYYM